MAFSNNYSGSKYTFEECNALLQGRNAKSKKLANNTYLLRGDDQFMIRLHSTDIITIYKDGTQKLNTGGWSTLTTKSRLNEHSNTSISQRGGVWYMPDGSLFYDGMITGPDGLDINGPKDPGQYEIKLKALKKKARKYAKDFVMALQAGKIDYPGAGDCWGCYFSLSGTTRIPEESRGKEQPFGTDHLIQHMKESYFVPSLLVNAGRAAGYRDEQIGLMGIGQQRVYIDPENNIYKYIVNQLKGDI